MPHSVNGFDLEFTSRTSWKAYRRRLGRIVDTVPVAWVDGRHQPPGTKDVYQDVWFRDPAEAIKMSLSSNPFFVAIAKAVDPQASPRAFDAFKTIFEVVATGRIINPQCIETRVLARATAT